MPPPLARKSQSLTRGKIRERRLTLMPRTARVVKRAMLKRRQVMSRPRQLRQRSLSATCLLPRLPVHPLMPPSRCRSCRTMRRRVPVRLKSPIDKPSAAHAPTPSVKCVAGRDCRSSALRAQRYGCVSLADQSEPRLRLPLGEIALIRESVMCVCAKGAHRAATRHRTF